MAEYLAGPKMLPLDSILDVSDFALKGVESEVLVNIPSFFSLPIVDLKSFLPVTFAKDGFKIITFGDLHFGGIIPNGDLIEKLCEAGKKTRFFDCPK